MEADSIFSYILFIFISTICYVLSWYIFLLGVKIYFMIVDSLAWNDEPITIGNLMEASFIFGILTVIVLPFGIGFLIVSIVAFFGVIVIGLFKKNSNKLKKLYNKLKNIYNVPNIKNVRIG